MGDREMVTAIAERRYRLTESFEVPEGQHISYSIVERFPGYQNLADAIFAPLLHDQRNQCFVLYTILMLLTVFTSGIALMRSFWWIGAVVHVVLVLSYVGSYTAILHNTSHKPMYVNRFSALNHIIPYVLAPFFGQTWNTYYFHHVKHHHVQNNGPDDISSTLRYQRDSVYDFACYFGRFFFFVAIELPAYFWSRRQYRESLATLGGELASFAVMFVAFRYNPLGAVAVLGIPFVIVRFGMMSGNWAQHAFVDPLDPKSDFKSSTICINHAYNKDAFNDGYHTSHHLNPLRHWTEHPTHMMKELAKYNNSGPIVFQKLDFMGLWFLLMTRNYKALASHYVHIGPHTLETGEVIALLKARVKCMSPDQLDAAFPKVKSQ